MIQHADGSWENPVFVEVDDSLSLVKTIFERGRRYPDDIAAEKRVGNGVWQEVTARELVYDIRALAKGLYAGGVRPDSHVAILAATSYEWAVLDLAILALGAVTVPIYETDSAIQIKHLLSDAKVSLTITQTLQQGELVRSVANRGLKEVLHLDSGALRKLRQKGRNIDDSVINELVENTTLDDVATVIYTSGTTGMPKGVTLSHGNFVRPLMQAYDLLPAVIAEPTARTLLFLPVAHVLARFVMHGVLMGRGRVGFSPDTHSLLHDIETFAPSAILAVPRVLEKVYNAATSAAGKGAKRRIFAWSAHQSRLMSEATRYPERPKAGSAVDGAPTADGNKDALVSDGPSLGLRVKHRAADALVLRKIRKLLGPNLNTLICGGAPLSPELADFYRGMGINLLQGYGLSETTGPITVQIPGDNPAGSVGYLWPGNSLKIAEDGELLLQGLSVSSCYKNLPKETAEAYRGGWFHTGDLARTDEDGRVYITGRKKELIVTAGGKNVSPETLEQSLSTHPLIDHVIVVGDGRPYISALITLDSEMLPKWLSNRGLPPIPIHEASANPHVKQSIQRAIIKANQAVSRAESIRRFRLIDDEFTVENGFLTPSLKLKRHRVLKEYADAINHMYEQTAEELAGTGGSI